MDADLQHPPEVLTMLALALRGPSVDLAIASRLEPGGGTDQLVLGHGDSLPGPRFTWPRACFP